MNHSNHGRRLLSAAAVVLGNAGYSLTVALFLEPAGLVAGGATGVALAFGRLTGLSVSGFLLAFTMSLDDFIITHFTKGAGINTLSTLIYSEVRRGIRPSMYALSTVIFVVVLVVLLIANFRKQPEKD